MLFFYIIYELFPNIVFDGVSVKFVKDHKHLVLILSNNMKWDKHIETIPKSASKVIGIMRKL